MKNLATSNSKAPGHSIRKSFPVLEMTCAACAVSVESILKSTEGVKDASVNFANQSALVDFDDRITTPAEMRKALQAIGYDMIVDEENPQEIQEEAQQKHYRRIKSRMIWSAILSVPVVVIGMFFMDLPYGNWISMGLSAIVVFYLGRGFFGTAWKQAKHGRANMDTLVALSTGIAFLFSAFNTIFPDFWHSRGMHAHVYFEAAAVIIAFISIGKMLEERAKSNTSSAIKKLMGLQPKTVRVLINGEEKEIPAAQVEIGNTVSVRPGERIPVDGMVSAGSSFVDESMITGESIPIKKATGDKVFAGTINQKGSFHFTAEKVGGDTILAQIIKTVKEAQGSKAPVQRLVDRVAGVFVPVVIGIAMLTFIAWILFGGENAFTHALLTSVSVLVIACPCALGLATPTAIMVGIGKGAENNILIKDAEALELGYKVNTVVLDKTGTITEGRPMVTDQYWESDREEFHRNVFYSIESRSEHPLADAIVSELKQRSTNNLSIDQFESLTGRGVKAAYEGKVYYAGNEKLLSENKIKVSQVMLSIAETWQKEAKTVVFFAEGTQVWAALAIADKIKATSRLAIETLQARGIDVVMLTGDNEYTAAAVASQVGVNHYEAEVLPNEKAEYIQRAQSVGRIVAMVGDGINDSQALAQADVSIAMGKGSDIAMDVAKMTLITSDLQYVPKALQLSKKTVLGIRQNLFWAFIYNLIGIPLAAGLLYPINGFLLDPMIAGAAMALSSVSVVSNSLRLKSTKI